MNTDALQELVACAGFRCGVGSEADVRLNLNWKSGARDGFRGLPEALFTAVFVALLAALVLPLPLSNCVVKNVEGKTTDPGTYCWGFSREIPTAQLLAG